MQNPRQFDYLYTMYSDPATTAAFTGHRTYCGQHNHELTAAVRTLYARGFRTFLNGMAVGFDLAAAEAVLSLRAELPGLRLLCVIPFPGQERNFSEVDRRRYRAVLDAAEGAEYVCTAYHAGCYALRNDRLVMQSSALVAWYDGSPGGTRYTVSRALRRGLRVCNCCPSGPVFPQPLPGLF